MRIAMLGHKRIPSREGGVEVVVEELSTRMVALGHTVTCYNRRGRHVSGAEYGERTGKEHKGVRLKKVWTIPKKGLAAMSASSFSAICAAFGRYDVVHFHAEGPCAMLWLPKLFGKKCVATVHGLDHQRAKWGKFASRYIMMGEKCAVRFADEIIVLSENVRQYFETRYGRKTLHIPNGVSRPTHREAEEITERFGLQKDGYILFLGRLVPEKGLRYLLEAFSQVKTDKRLVIAGGTSDSGDFAQEIREMAQKDPRVLFTGFVQGRALEELYSNAYLYVLPSDLEGMPLTLLEAMSYGNCCLTSDIAECTEVMEDFGVTFRRSDPVHLRERLQTLCDSEETVARYRASAADYICEKYSWERVVARTLRVYGADADSEA